ncbi:MAG: hypothetical protein WBX25_02720 [Rhodomicrobium sp.]
MYRRSMPPFPDLKSFLAYLGAKGDVLNIAVPVDMNLEATEVHRRVIAAGGPVCAAHAVPILPSVWSQALMVHRSGSTISDGAVGGISA